MDSLLDRVAHYRLISKLGEGGMGVVYAAHDERLDRPVAIKMIRTGAADEGSRERLWREARSAASVNHPNICQLYEIGEERGELFIAMELLEGESLATRLNRGSVALADAVGIVLAILAALEPLHARGFVHRDLKPSNVFLTPHGVKLLDFGLARPIAGGSIEATQLTHPGMVMGTPHYLSPEQLLGRPIDGRSDLFALGSLLYEALSGRQAFTGSTAMEIFSAVLHQEPPALGGSPSIVSVDRVLRRALAKTPERRYPDAASMASDLRSALLLSDTSGETVRAQPMHRLIVLPFRILKPDPDTDFLAFSLPDAISSSLSSLDAIVVRSSLAAARFAGEDVSLEQISEQADVDTVLTGTLLRAGNQVRVSTQMAQTPGGAVLWAQTSQVALGDMFQLQDAVVRRIVESLLGPLSAREQRALQHDVPSDPNAYELYLRANTLATQASQWTVARDLYLRCLELDPTFAPAWARLGRIYRVLSTYGGERGRENYDKAEQAFRRSLDLNPELSIAHHLYAGLEVDLGRAQQAMVRLLERASGRGSDTELLAGLVQTCRYCGLNEAAVAAYEQAVRLDPGVRTSVSHAYLMLGDYQRSIDTCLDDGEAVALDLMGRRDDAIAHLRRVEQQPIPKVIRDFTAMTRLALEGRGEECRALYAQGSARLAAFRDPCPHFYVARVLGLAGAGPEALAELARSVEDGFTAFEFTAKDPWFESVRGTDEFRAILRRAEARERRARAAFIAAGGDRILGLGRV